MDIAAQCSAQKFTFFTLTFEFFVAGKDVQRDDARSRRGLRAAPPKSRKLQPPSPEHSGRHAP